MSHLGAKAAAVVDGELGHAARERALAHLANCAECRAEVEAQRRLKARLHSLGPTTPPADLTGRLMRLQPPSRPPAAAARRPGTPGPRTTRRRRAAVGGGTLLVALAAALAAGGRPAEQPPVDPTAPTFLIEHAANSSEPMSGVVGAAVTASYAR